MAKLVKKAATAEAKKPQREVLSHNVAGAGFRKTYSAAELTEIKTKRQEMRSRLFAAG
jgi:hypothetical protein